MRAASDALTPPSEAVLCVLSAGGAAQPPPTAFGDPAMVVRASGGGLILSGPEPMTGVSRSGPTALPMFEDADSDPPTPADTDSSYHDDASSGEESLSSGFSPTPPPAPSPSPCPSPRPRPTPPVPPPARSACPPPRPSTGKGKGKRKPTTGAKAKGGGRRVAKGVQVVDRCPVPGCVWEGPWGLSKFLSAHLNKRHAVSEFPQEFIMARELAVCPTCSQVFVKLGKHAKPGNCKGRPTPGPRFVPPPCPPCPSPPTPRLPPACLSGRHFSP